MEVPPVPPVPQPQVKTKRFPVVILVAILLVGIVAGGLVGYGLSYSVLNGKISDVQNQLQTQLQNLPPQNATYVSYPNTTYVLNDNVSLSQLYMQIKDSVVVIRGYTVSYDMFRRAYYTQVQGSGFVYNFTGQMVVITNYHVVQDTVNNTVTFINGNAYAAAVLGSDPYADLAVLSTDAPQDEYRPIEIVDSSTLSVGDPLIAVGGPYGLAGTMTTGIVSALGRTITEDMSGSYPIANVIQTSTPINSGNSGGPLLNYYGQVVGITTAIVSESQGLGFAIPSSTILREIGSLKTGGSYNEHPTIGAAGTDMTYEIAKAMNVNVTYGWLISQVTANGPADTAGLQAGTKRVTVAGDAVIIGGDIIIAINGTRITNIDDLSTYLEENTSPGEVITVTIVRGNQTMELQLTIGTRISMTTT
jgi:S1-C subfamily serine protease